MRETTEEPILTICNIVDNAIDGIISFVYAEIECSNLSAENKGKEKESQKFISKALGEALKDHLRATGQLLED